jgi:hypothetical protein
MKALTADMTTDAKITEAPRNNSVTGYGPKIPTRYMFRIANRWHRVYIAQYGNSGSAYVVIGGQDHYLAGSAEFVLETIGQGGTYAEAVASLTAMHNVHPWMKESEVKS